MEKFRFYDKSCFIDISEWKNQYPVPSPLYSVMHSDRNSLCGDVVLDSVNMAIWDEDNILDQYYVKQICLDFSYGHFISL